MLIFAVTTLLIILGSSLYLVYNDKFYLNECKKLNTDCSKSLQVLKYLESKGQLNEEFNLREISHMKDVKKLIDYITIAFLFLIAVLISASLPFLLERINIKKFLGDYFLYNGIFSLSVILLFSVLSYLKFDLVFNIFHGLFFKSGTWIFSENDALIKLFPLEFFIDALFFILLTSISTSIILSLIGLVIKRFK